VRDEDHRQTPSFPERLKHGEEFHLRRGVERRGRLISNHNGWAAGNRLRDEHALPLSSAQLVWIGARNAVRIFSKEFCENLTRPLVQRAFSRGAVRGQHLTNLFARAQGWMERQGGLLENQRNAPATDLLQFVRFGPEKIFPFKVDRPANAAAPAIQRACSCLIRIPRGRR